MSANNLAGMFLAKYSPTGTHVWSRGFSAMTPWGFVTGKGIVVDGAGNIVVSGGVTGSGDFDGTLLGYGTVDVLVAKFTPADGRTLWAKCYGGQMDDYSLSVTIGAADNILATGYYTYTVDFGGGVMDSPGGFDGFIVKLKP